MNVIKGEGQAMIDKAPRRPVLLIVMDGFGVNPSCLNNAVAVAETPHLDACFAFILVNFANGDMAGHTAVWHAALEAVETLDREVDRVLAAARAAGYSVILTADHGNCEELVSPTIEEPQTQHTVYPVPCVVIDEQVWQLSGVGGLSNIAPAVLQLMGLGQPAAMTGRSLLLRPLEPVGCEKSIRAAA